MKRLLLAGCAVAALAAVVAAVTAVLVSMGTSQVIANLIATAGVGVIVALIAWSMISASLAAWKASRLNLDKTTHSLARDTEVVKESFQ